MLQHGRRALEQGANAAEQPVLAALLAGDGAAKPVLPLLQLLLPRQRMGFTEGDAVARVDETRVGLHGHLLGPQGSEADPGLNAEGAAHRPIPGRIGEPGLHHGDLAPARLDLLEPPGLTTRLGEVIASDVGGNRDASGAREMTGVETVLGGIAETRFVFLVEWQAFPPAQIHKLDPDTGEILDSFPAPDDSAAAYVDGLNLAYDGAEEIDGATFDKIELTFEGVGLTPGDTYWAFISRDTGLMERWAYFLQDWEEGREPTHWQWLDWGRYGDVMLSPKRVKVDDGSERPLGELAVFDQLPDSIFESPRSVEIE